LGVLAAAILEPLLIRRLTFGSVFTVGFIEEFAKILGVVVIARRWRHDNEMDGLVLGAAAGMGFAAFESCGYAFTAFLRSGGSLSVTVFVTLLRGILSPLGHGTWTAILSSVLFRESQAGRFRLTLKVIGAFITVSVLHGLWDGVPGLITILFGPGPDVLLAQVVIGLIGLAILWRRWREARHLQTTPA
jgi:RsiW-degrading membrane proteinase PrsW (M82 family)